MIEDSAPGRICLLGEHCDWAGGAALVVPLDRSVRVTAAPAETLSASSSLEGRELRWDGGDPGPLALVPAVAEVLAERLGRPVTGALRFDSDLPAGRGFSSSAAFAVATARVLARLAGKELGADEAADVAYVAEHDRLGIACGRMDQLACAYGLPLFLRFEGGDPAVEPVPARLALAVGSFRRPRDTAGILAALARHHRGDVPLRDWDGIRRVGAVRGAIEGFAVQARHGRVALLEGDLRALGGAMDACQEIYEEELMTAFPELHAPGLVRAARALKAAGALGAKFSGAGGEGSVVGLFSPGGPAGAGVVALDALGLDAFSVEVWCSV